MAGDDVSGGGSEDGGTWVELPNSLSLDILQLLQQQTQTQVNSAVFATISRLFRIFFVVTVSHSESVC